MPVQFFYEEAPVGAGRASVEGAAGLNERPSEGYVYEFIASREGIELNRAFMRIADAKVRRSLIELVRSVAGDLPE